MGANAPERVTSQPEDVAETGSTHELREGDDITRVSEMANHSSTQKATAGTSDRSPQPPTETATGQPSRSTKFIDRRTETFISTVSTSALDDIARDSSDVVDKCHNNRHQATSQVLRPTKHRDRKLISSPSDCRHLGVASDVAVHRSMLTTVPATAATTTAVNAARAATSLIVLRSDRPQKDAVEDVTAATVSPPSAESRLTVTLAESTGGQQSHRHCHLITRPATDSTKTRDVATSGSESANDDISSRLTAVRSPVSSRRSCERSGSSSRRSAVDGDATLEPAPSKSTIGILAQLPPVAVQRSSGPGRPTSPDRQDPTTLLASSAAAAEVASSTVTSLHAVVESVKSPPPPPQPELMVSTSVTSQSSPVKPRCVPASTSVRHEGPSPSTHELCRDAESLVTEGASVMTALDDALAMLTSVCQHRSWQPHPATTVVTNARADLSPIVDQATTCNSPNAGKYHHYTARYAAAQRIVIGPVCLFAAGGRCLWVGVWVGLLPR